MSDFEHKKVTEVYYEISFSSSNRGLPAKIDQFFDGFDFDSLDEDCWQDGHLPIRDYEGDFEGIEIYPEVKLKPVYEFVAKKLGVNISEIDGITLKLTC